MSAAGAFASSASARAVHASRVPSIRFLGKNRIPASHHAPSPHPAAPQAIINAFPSFLKKLSASTKQNAASSSSSSTKAASSSAPAAKASSLPAAMYEGEWAMPQRLQRNRYAPTQAEIEAVESGGASAAPLVTKASRKSWYTPAQF